MWPLRCIPPWAWAKARPCVRLALDPGFIGSGHASPRNRYLTLLCVQRRRLPEKSIGEHACLADDQDVAVPTNFQRICLVRRRKNDALTGRQHRHEADRRSRLALRKGRDNAESIGLNGVVGDAGHVAEIDAPALDWT